MTRPRKDNLPPVETAPVEEVVVVAPAPTSPAVLALQESIVTLVKERDECRARVSHRSVAVAAAQAKLRAASSFVQQENEALMAIEQEVHYRLGLIAQLEGRDPSPVYDAPRHSIGMVTGPNLVTIPQQQYQASDDMINRGHATRAAI